MKKKDTEKEKAGQEVKVGERSRLSTEEMPFWLSRCQTANCRKAYFWNSERASKSL